MLHSLRPLATLVFLCLAQEALAGYRGNISFDLADQDRHLQGIQTIMKRASQCLREDLSRHQEFLKRFGISAFYGDNSSFAKKIVRGPDGREIRVSTSPEEKRNMLRSYGIGESLLMDFVPAVSCFSVGENPVPLENPAFRDQCRLALRPTSCIGLSLKCLGEGFHAAGQDDLWNQILQFTVENGVQGDALQVALQKLGWRIAYWNPDLSAAERWDLQEQREYPGDPKHIWGQHVETSRSVLGPRHRYYLQTVDDWWSLVNFGQSTPDAVKNIPFFVGIAHLGYHVFPGSYGQIIEGHSTRQLNDPQALETSPFNPLVKGGGPRGGPYKSGLIAIPPGYL